jgi:hypothetical protein
MESHSGLPNWINEEIINERTLKSAFNDFFRQIIWRNQTKSLHLPHLTNNKV